MGLNKGNGLNASKLDIITLRRSKVAALRLRGLSQRQIWEALAYGGKEGIGRFINTTTGEPFSLGTINGDLQALDREWQEQAAGATALHKGREYAEIQAIKALAFTQSNPDLALKAIALEMKLLGTAAPEKQDVTLHWQDQAIADIRAGAVTYPALAQALENESLAADLFRLAGVPVTVNEEMNS